jgi:hypothetical protein
MSLPSNKPSMPVKQNRNLGIVRNKKYLNMMDATRSSVCVDIGDEIEWVLVVETRLRLWPLAPDYSDDRVSALQGAAEAFKADKKNKIDRVRLICVRD